MVCGPQARLSSGAVGQYPIYWLDYLRRDHHRQVDRFVADLFQRAARLELDLPLRVLDDMIRLGSGLQLELFSQPITVGPALSNDRLRVVARPLDDLSRFDVQPFQLLLRLLGVVQRLADRVL